MAEPLGIVGVVGVTTQILQMTTKLGLNWKDVPSDVKSFIHELRSLKTVLSEANMNLLLNPDLMNAFTGRESAFVSQLGTPSKTTDTQMMLADCKAEMETLLGDLNRIKQGHCIGWERLKAAFLAPRMRETVEDVRRRCDMVNSLVAIDALVIGAGVHKEVKESRNEQRIWNEASIDAMRDLNVKMDTINGRQQTQQQDQYRESVLSWLSTVDYQAEQQDQLSRRQPGTGQWLLNSDQYLHWLKTKGQTLFCPGIPGAGKTVLTSIAVHDATSRATSEAGIGLAFIYCKYQRTEEQTLQGMLLSLMKQLVSGVHPLPESFIAMCGSYMDKRARPWVDDLSKDLESISACYSRVYVFVDGLDECFNADGRRDRLLDILFNVQKASGINLFMTSRLMHEIMDKFESYPTVEIRASETDIQAYLVGRISDLPKFVSRRPELQKEVSTRVAAAVKGMFLLAKLYLDSLIGVNSPKALRHGIEKIEAGSGVYDLAYQGAMERIRGQTQYQRESAQRTIYWITCAKRQLTIAELQEALAVEEGEPALDRENISELEDLVSACAGLVTVDEGSRVVRLVHFTAQEFFERTQNDWFPEAEGKIVATCMTYLSFDTFATGRVRSGREFERRLAENVFYDYAAKNWGHHARLTSMSFSALPPFLQNAKLIDASVQALLEHEWGTSQNYEETVDTPSGMTPLHLAAYFGLSDIVRFVAGSCDLDVEDSAGFTGLCYAARNGHLDVVRLLLDEGAVVSTVKGRAEPLTEASSHGHASVVGLLLDKCADIEAKDQWGQSVLHLATSLGHMDAVKLLLDRGADIEAKGPRDQSVLHSAALGGYADAIKLLLDRGADIKAKDQWGESVLHLATSLGHMDAVKLLLDRGADIEAKDKWGKNALHLATFHRHTDIIKLFLDRGAGIEAKDQWGQSALFLATSFEHEDVIKLFLDRGAKFGA